MHDRANPEVLGKARSSSQTLAIVAVCLIGFGMAAAQILLGGVKLIYGLPAYVILGVGVLAAVGLWQPRNAGKPVGICVAGALVLTAYVVWRAQTSPVDYLARSDFYMVIAALVSYAVTAVYVTGSRMRLWLVWSLLGLAMLHVAVGVKQFSEAQNFMLLPWVFRPDYTWRASGFYICPNHLAGLLEMIGLMALSITIWGRCRPWVRIVAGYFFAVALAGVAFSGSRGGYLSTVGGLMIFGALSLWCVRHVKRRWFWGMLMIAMLSLVAGIGVAGWVMSKSTNLQQRMAAIYDPQNMRVHMWRAALTAYELSPVTGVGAGTYLYYGRHFRDPSVQGDPQHVHSDYLELLCEYGILGCAAMALFLVPHLISGLAGVRGVLRERLKPLHAARSNELALLIGALSGLGAVLLHSVIDFNLHIPANVMVCALWLGILANPRSEDPDRPLRWRIRGPWMRFGFPIVATALIAFSVPRIQGEYYGERARMYARDQMNREAIEYAERAIRLDPKNPRLYTYLGEAKHNLAMLQKDPGAAYKLHAEAALALTEGLKYFPTDTQLLLKLARALDNIQKFTEAEVVYRAALEADPSFGNVYAYFGHHYFLQRRLIRAEKLYNRARELQEAEVAPLGLKDIARYRELAAKEETADLFPIDDLPGDEDWEPGAP